jgi:hypothetical protein
MLIDEWDWTEPKSFISFSLLIYSGWRHQIWIGNWKKRKRHEKLEFLFVILNVSGCGDRQEWKWGLKNSPKTAKLVQLS